MTAGFVALAPVFLVIALGAALRRWLTAEPLFWRQAERLTYFVLFPALLVDRLWTTTPPGHEVAATIAALCLPAIAITLAGLLLRPVSGLSGRDFATCAMGAIRFNTYAGLAGAVALFGQPGLTVFALLLAVYIPLVNVISSLLLGRFAMAGAASPRVLVRVVATNPLVLACAAGIALNLSGLPLPELGNRLLTILGSAALGLGLLSVGAALHVESLVADRRAIAIASFVKLAVLPAGAALMCHLLGVHGVARGVVLMFAALPSSPSAYVLARQLGGNAAMMAGIVTVTTPAAMVAMPLALALFG